MLVKEPFFRKENLPVTKGRRLTSHLVGTSETTRVTSYDKNEIRFNQWLAGLIDGDGTLQVSKAGYTSCEITVALADERLLRLIQNKLGGSIKARSGVKAIRWRLHNKAGMLELINRVNGYIRHSTRFLQLNRVCTILNIQLLSPDSLHLKHGWFSGFFDAAGSVDYIFNDSLKTLSDTPQLNITVTDKHFAIVSDFKNIFGGLIHYDKGRNGFFRWTICLDIDLANFLNYCKSCPIQSIKRNRIFDIKNFNRLRNLEAYQAPKGTILNKAWVNFNINWNQKRGLFTNTKDSAALRLRLQLREQGITQSAVILKKLEGYEEKIHPSLAQPPVRNTKIIVWGSLMSSGLGIGRITKQLALIFYLTPLQQSVLIGLLLSDGWLIYANRNTSINPRLGFKQSLNKFSYFFHVFNVFSPFCMSLPSLVVGQRKLTTTYALNFFTRSLPCLIPLHKIFYCNSLKIVPEDIFNLLDPIALSHWICGDGSVRSLGLILCTDSYTLKDVIRLMNVLIIRYELHCTLRLIKNINSNKYRIYIKQTSMDKLKNIVEPYMHISMLYKIHIDSSSL